MIPVSPTDIRRVFVERLHVDLVGPASADEVLIDRPSDRYLTAILYPQQSRIPDEEDESLGVGDDEPFSGSDTTGAVPLTSCIRPASMGLSFCVSSDGAPAIIVPRITAGTYRCRYVSEDGETLVEEKGHTADRRWQREGHNVTLPPITVDTRGPTTIPLGDHGLPGLQLYLQTAPTEEGTAVTAVLINSNRDTDDRTKNEENSFFQVRLDVGPGEGTRLLERPVQTSIASEDPEDDESGALIYRDVREYAVGHTCAAGWDPADGDPSRVTTTWIPERSVPAMSHDGHPVFGSLRGHSDYAPLSAQWIAEAATADLVAGLRLLPHAYGVWVKEKGSEIPALPPEFRATAERHRRLWKVAGDRMAESIAFVEKNEDARRAFQLANAAMAKQKQWLDGSNLIWRPFQLGYQLLVLKSLLRRDDEHRSVMDLLWFPTGGGKTEAYLALMAACFFHRRLHALREGGDADRGGGVGVLMRYTLRLLTAQQFERAARLVCACESIRRRDPGRLGAVPISVGLWIGSSATSNTVRDARQDTSHSSRQVRRCPCCDERLDWPANASRYECRCPNTDGDCELADPRTPLPIWTVDEDIYRELPSLLIGTIDKFAQIVRKPETGRFFGAVTSYPSPDLILQDELHLITGPLGTIAGLYEVAVDELCRRNGGAPKVIGSTATIKRAGRQVKALFDRGVYQFPPPGLTADDSCFAVRDDSKPGRLYLGVTTAGRSPKFTLQAVSASLLQSPLSALVPDEERDDYWTLVTYFNSLRELGGAHVMMLDDVPKSIGDYANRRGEQARSLEQPGELSSNLAQARIPDILKELGQRYGEDGVHDVILATTMISVGMDIPRLALMVVVGQPKTTSEYIQATSRVGRDRVPGLVVGVYNASKARDRSHYETFSTWHGTLYRDVEATSVTPFASRAQDKALHAVLVALVRHTVAEMTADPELTAARRAMLVPAIEAIVARAGRIDPAEEASVARKLDSLLDHWENRGALSQYWNDYKHRKRPPLMMSAEAHAALRAVGINRLDIWPTLNSMRDVEPSTVFRLVEALKVEEDSDGEQ